MTKGFSGQKILLGPNPLGRSERLGRIAVGADARVPANGHCRVDYENNRFSDGSVPMKTSRRARPGPNRDAGKETPDDYARLLRSTTALSRILPRPIAAIPKLRISRVPRPKIDTRN